GRVRNEPFVRRPAVVDETPGPVRPVVDLLPAALADVADVEVAVGAVKRKAPGIPEAVCVGLPAPAVQPQELAEPAREVLGVIGRIAPGAAVSGPRIQPPVWTELELPAVVVIGGAVVDDEQLSARRSNRRARPGTKRVDLDVAALVRVVDVEEVVLRVARMEGDRQQPLLGVAAFHPAADVEKGTPLAAGERHDAARPLDHVEAPGLALRLRDIDGLVEAGGDLPEGVAGTLDVAAAQRGNRTNDCREDCCSEGPHSLLR